MINITDDEFLNAIFGENTPWVHVTDFPYPPDNIPKDKHLIAWKGDYYSRYHFQPNTNRYFTISTFYCDEQQQARRRKALYRQTHCLVLDDVREKLSEEAASKLPRPSWILETSKGSFQWGYIFQTPVTEASKIDNLNDGLIASELAPDGKDPGQRGITRYVKLPSSINNKSSKLVNGQPFKSIMHLWEPFNRVTIEQLAAPFHVDLNAVRREQRVDGAAAVDDHPILQIPNIIKVKEVRSDGRFDITCPWVHEHTNQDDSGSAVFTNQDGSIGFKCHHGNCQDKTGRHLLHFIEQHQPGFTSQYKNWQILREFKQVSEPSFFAQETTTQETAPVNFIEPSVQPVDAIQTLIDQLRREHPSSIEGRNLAAAILKHTDDLPKLDQVQWHDTVRDLMGWSKGECKEILKDLRQQWYGERISSADFYDKVVYVKELNQFYDWESRIFFSTDAFQNSFSHEDAEARKIALQDGRVTKVDRLDYAPKYPRIFSENGAVYANTWTDTNQSQGIKGDISRWYEHFDALGWQEHRDHIIQWLAFTLQHPDKKINHMLILGSGEGCGKDFLLYPLLKSMGDNATVIAGEELLSGFNDYLLSKKYVHVNEAELGDRREALTVSNKLKPLAAAPPDTLRVNPKGIKPIDIRNIVNATMTTNSIMPIRLNGASRRFFAIWSDLNPRDELGNMKREWLTYWEDRWNWMKSGGWKHVTYHLLNEVDTSNFNPGEAPPMTDFLREIEELSKSPMLQTIEIFIKKQHGVFKCDLLTAQDMSSTLRSGGVFAPNDMYLDSKYFTPIKIGMVLKASGFKRVVCYDQHGERIRLWVLRDNSKYESMRSGELSKEYQRQITEAHDNTTMQVVN